MLPSGKRIPGLKLDHPRQLALMHALVCFAHIAVGNTFTTAELYPYVLAALHMSANQYSLAQLRYDLRKLRVKHLIQKLPKSRRYRLSPKGYSICLVFLKLFERVYSPLTAGLLQPYRADSKLQDHELTQLDLQSVCERWIYSSCLCFALDLAEQKLERVPLSVCQLSGRIQPQPYFRLRSGDGSGFSVLD